MIRSYREEVGVVKDIYERAAVNSRKGLAEAERVIERIEEEYTDYFDCGKYENSRNLAHECGERTLALRVKGQNRMRRVLCSNIAVCVAKEKRNEYCDHGEDADADEDEYGNRGGVKKVYMKRGLSLLYQRPVRGDPECDWEGDGKRLRILCTADRDGKMEDVFQNVTGCARSLAELKHQHL